MRRLFEREHQDGRRVRIPSARNNDAVRDLHGACERSDPWDPLPPPPLRRPSAPPPFSRGRSTRGGSGTRRPWSGTTRSWASRASSGTRPRTPSTASSSTSRRCAAGGSRGGVLSWFCQVNVAVGFYTHTKRHGIIGLYLKRDILVLSQCQNFIGLYHNGAWLLGVLPSHLHRGFQVTCVVKIQFSSFFTRGTRAGYRRSWPHRSTPHSPPQMSRAVRGTHPAPQPHRPVYEPVHQPPSLSRRRWRATWPMTSTGRSTASRRRTSRPSPAGAALSSVRPLEPPPPCVDRETNGVGLTAWWTGK